MAAQTGVGVSKSACGVQIQSSGKIVEIISVIDGIAFQTNILNQAITQMDQVTQQNAALVEEAAAAAEAMQGQAASLVQAVSVFKLDAQARLAPAAARPARPVARPAPRQAMPIARVAPAGPNAEWETF